MNFSEVFFDSLLRQGYTHCFFVAGGNIMHLLNAARNRFECIPVVHEVTAVIASEYFNESQNSRKSFVLVTAGPGITNALTGIAGAWLESRFVLVIGGQVKVEDLKKNGVRQIGIQEIDGISIVKSVCKNAIRIDKIIDLETILELIANGNSNRAGPVFLEICIDIQAATYSRSLLFDSSETRNLYSSSSTIDEVSISKITSMVHSSKRPILLIGGGVSRWERDQIRVLIDQIGIPTMTTWNGADRIDANSPYYFGRPNTWGQRFANVLIQQCDLLLAVGTRLGLQQTGFNWGEFIPNGLIVQVDIDQFELDKESPRKDFRLNCDANLFVNLLLKQLKQSNFQIDSEWLGFLSEAKDLLPVIDIQNSSHNNFVNPFELISILSQVTEYNDILVPCSSGGAFTVFMQTYSQSRDQIIISNKGLASMGYGLAGAIGASLANQEKNVILIEGDGSFSQNIQELATVVRNALSLKIIIFDNGGYASIRMTQRNYFGGAFIGCDSNSGLGFPNWEMLCEAYSLQCKKLNVNDNLRAQLYDFVRISGPAVLLVPIHPEQTYFPKISSAIQENGTMKSNPIHLMHPPIDDSLRLKLFKFLEINNE